MLVVDILKFHLMVSQRESLRTPTLAVNTVESYCQCRLPTVFPVTSNTHGYDAVY